MSLIGDINSLNSWANESRMLLWDLDEDIDYRYKDVFGHFSLPLTALVAKNNALVLGDLLEAMQWFVYGVSSPFHYVKWVNVHAGLYYRESEITWKAICEAWIKNDFEGRTVTIACIDRMRQLLWDEPFYVAWAARPEDKEF